MKWTNHFMGIAFLVLITGQLFAGYQETIPPEILKQYDPAIINGTRPTYETITQADIFGLRKNPYFKSDFVRLNFDPDKLSTTQKKIFFHWLEGGYAKILLEGLSVEKYGRFLGQTLQANHTNTDGLIKARGTKVDLFIDAQQIRTESCHDKKRGYYLITVSNPAEKVITLARFSCNEKDSAIGIFKARNTPRLFFLWSWIYWDRR